MSYKLGLIELIHPKKHGIYNNQNIYYHHLYSLNISVEDFFLEFPSGLVNFIIQTCHHHFIGTNNSYYEHPNIRNYRDIICKKGHISLEIIEPSRFDMINNGAEYHLETCIIKTVWLKIFQRKWKKYYKDRMHYLKNPKSLMNRQIYGKWI